MSIKTILHKFATGDDEASAEYYADRYMPRVFHGYPDSHQLDSQIVHTLFFILAFRMSRIYALIKNSIINRHGYETLTAQQSNLSAAVAFGLPVNKLRTFVNLVYSHRKQCNEDPGTRQKHLSLADDIQKSIDEESIIEFAYLQNPISFEKCYGVLEYDSESRTRPSWAKDWYVPKPVMRLDPTELSWLITISIAGTLLASSIVTLSIGNVTTKELCTIAEEFGEDSCLMQIPWLLLNLVSIIKVFDLIILVVLQLPQQVEGAVFYYDCSIMISRARKVKRAIEENIRLCLAESRSDKYLYTMHAKRSINRSIWLHIRLIRCLYREFQDLRAAYTIFLNILLVGGGLSLSMSVTAILTSDSFFKRIILESMVIAHTVEMTLSVLFCIMIESTVSIDIRATINLSRI